MIQITNLERPSSFTSTDIDGSTSNDTNDIGDTSTVTASNLCQNHKSSNRLLQWSRKFILCFCRISCLDLPLFLALSLYAIILHAEWIGDKYLIPLIQLQKFDYPEQALTYYHRVCTENDQTTYDTTDLLVDITNTNSSTNDANHKKIDEAVEKMLFHGVTIIPNLISEPTATKLRDYIMEQNTNDHRDDIIGVIENDFRYSFGIRVDEHPIIAVALEEILFKNPALVAYLEAMMGSDPAVTEFTAISQDYGAVDQNWHEDVVPDGSAVKYGRSFVPTYNLFIPLQNVTAEMGATWICPGTHMCSESSFCPDTGFQASGDSNHWPLGHGIFMNQQLTHRGGAHRDPNGPQRVVFILTFAPRPRVFPNTSYKSVETRKIGLGGSYSQHFSQWGHTLSDYQQPLKYMRQPYRTLRSLGIYSNRGDSRWGWDYVTVCTGSLGNDDETCLPVRTLKRKVMKAKNASMMLYQLCIAAYILFILLFAFLPRMRRSPLPWYLLRNTLRIGAIHAVVICAAWLVRHRIIESTWGRNIHAERSFRISDQNFFLTNTSQATLPEERDILFFEGMYSPSANSHTRAIHSVHPGNIEWGHAVDFFALEYDSLSVTLQEHIRRQMLDTIRQHSRRILMQNEQLNWTQVSPELGHILIHEQLRQMSNRYVNCLIHHLDLLNSEARYGFWRNTALFRKHILVVLTRLRMEIIGIAWQRVSTKKSRMNRTDGVESQKSALFVSRSNGMLPDKHSSQKEFSSLKCGSVPCVNDSKQAIPWLNVGDIVEATFGVGEFIEWYRCTIISASSDQNVWDVICDDGEVKKVFAAHAFVLSSVMMSMKPLMFDLGQIITALVK